MPKLTEAFLKDLPDASQSDRVFWDTDYKGFGLRVRASGRKSWIVQYRTTAGAQRKATLGTWPTISAEHARRRARIMLGTVAEGQDPAAAKAIDRRKLTVADLAARYQTDHIDIKNKPSTAKEFRRLLKKHILPPWRSQTADSITSNDVSRLHHSMRNTPRVANQVLAVASKMFSLAERWGVRSQHSNPCVGVERYPEPSRERFASDAELQRLGSAIDQAQASREIPTEAGAVIRLLALSGLRMSEALNLRWSDVDLDRGRLVIRDAKAGGRTHVVGEVTVSLLRSQARNAEWVFPAENRAYRLSKGKLHASWVAVRTRAQLADLRLHDLRHGYGTFAGQAGANAFLVRDALGHKTLAMTGRYVNRDDNPLRVLADQVSGRIDAALGTFGLGGGGPAGPVIPGDGGPGLTLVAANDVSTDNRSNSNT